jgi:hypothetical protein
LIEARNFTLTNSQSGAVTLQSRRPAACAKRAWPNAQIQNLVNALSWRTGQVGQLRNASASHQATKAKVSKSATILIYLVYL